MPEGYLQASGRDSRNRKQYLYHPRWREHQSHAKYDRMLDFAEALPKVRRRVSADLSRYGVSREKVLALVVRLLEVTLVRVGNRAYARDNDSYGITTLHDEHVDIQGARLNFRFRGKSGKLHRIGFRDWRLARVIRQTRDIPGQELFQYLDESGEPRAIESGDVNEYLHSVSGAEITAKDFRTWGGTVRVVARLWELGPGGSERETVLNLTEAIKEAAHQLGNRPSTCRKYYVHPAVVESYRCGRLIEILSSVNREIEREPERAPFELNVCEATVVTVLRNHWETGESPEPADMP